MSDHKRIWLQPECCACPTDGRLWCQDPDPVDCEDGVPWTEYIRADIAEKREAELVEALKAARQFIVLEGFPIGWNVSRIDSVLAPPRSLPREGE